MFIFVGAYIMGTTMSNVVDPAYSSAPAQKPRPAAEPFIQRTWPEVAVGLGLGLSVVWTFFLGYGLVKLAHLAILEIAS